MSKGIIVVDIPCCCLVCSECFHADDMHIGDNIYKKLYRCGHMPENVEDPYLGDRCVDIKGNEKPEWCPIREVPQKKEVQGVPRKPTMGDFMRSGFQKGWNDCIDEILKGGDES